jgi:hypothetical protein
MNTRTLEHLWDTVEYLSSLRQPKFKSVRERQRWQKTFCDKAKAGHDDYGIVQEPCVVHLEGYESVAMWLWQEGSDWEC